MSLAAGLFRGLYPRFLGWVLAVGLGLAAAGCWPTARWSGPRGVEAMLAAIGVAVLASVVGGLPLALAGRIGLAPHQAASAALAGIGLRLFLAAGLGFAVMASGRFVNRPLVVWLGVSYLALLVVDTYFALKAFRAASVTEK